MFKGASLDNYGGVVRDRSTTPPKLVKFGRKSSMNSILEESVSIFDDAKALIPIDPFFRFVMWLYSNRVLVLLAVTHFVATVLIWGKFYSTYMLISNLTPIYAHQTSSQSISVWSSGTRTMYQ